MEKIPDIIKHLKSSDRFGSKIVHVELLGQKNPVYGDTKNLGDKINSYLSNHHIRLYRHQCQAMEKISQGHNLIITTPTASGKTLAFNLPVFDMLIKDQQSTALYIYPTKALANDQLKKIRDMEEAMGLNFYSDIYDGDTSRARRSRIRSRSRVIITNPYQLHHSLGWHWKWESFFRNIKYIVIDEAHQYRGVFGSNIAMLIRRLRRIMDYYGANPQFILSTATLANPVEFGEKLTGLKFEIIAEDGSPRGDKYFLLYNPFLQDRSIMSTHQETVDLLIYMVKLGIQTLCFTTSRKMAELIAKWTKDKLDEQGSKLGSSIASYKAGYLPRQRRNIETAIKEDRLKGIVSTNALELGIDIGNLDSVIISGFPGTIISTRQQAGRAGRKTNPSIVVMVAFQNPLDQYLVNHPHYIFKSSPENAIIDVDNTYINTGQLLCASAELPLKEDRDNKYFGANWDKYLPDFKHSGLLKDTPRGWIYCGNGSPSHIVDLENFGQTTYTIVNGGEVMETVSQQQAYREAYQGAVMVHQGQTFIVQDFNIDRQVIEVERRPVDYYTKPLKNTDIRIEETLKQPDNDTITFYGRIMVKENYYAYKIIKNDRTIGTNELKLPPIEFDTYGLWFTIPGYIEDKVKRAGLDFNGGLHGMEHCMIAIMPLLVMCDRWDIGGVSFPYYPANGKPTIFIYDSYQGGIGLSEKAFDLFGKLVNVSYELVRDCSCENGCPACVFSPKCGNDNQPLDKSATKLILHNINGIF